MREPVDGPLVRGVVADAAALQPDPGQLRPWFDPDRVAREILAARDGLQVPWVVSCSRLDFVADGRTCLDRLTRALSTGGRGVD